MKTVLFKHASKGSVTLLFGVNPGAVSAAVEMSVDSMMMALQIVYNALQFLANMPCVVLTVLPL